MVQPYPDPSQGEPLTPPLQEGHELVLGRPYWDASWPWPLSAIEDFMKGLWDFIMDLPWTIIETIWGFVSDFWNFVSDGFNSMFNWIGSALDTIWEGISSIFSQVWTGISGAFDTVTSWISDMLSLFAESISRSLQAIWDGISSGLTAVGNAIMGALQSVWDAVAGWFKDLATSISGAFTNLGQWVGESLSTVWENMGEWLRSFAESITEGFNAFAQGFQEAFVEPIAKLPANILGGVIDFVSDVGARLGNIIVKLFEPIADFFVTDILGGLLRVFQPFAEFFADTLESFFATLTGQINQGGSMTPENAYSVVPSLISVLGIMLLGFTGMTVAGELLHPLKEMGLGNVSAILYDVSNYRLISGAFVGALTYSMIREPCGYYFNRWFRPRILQEREIRELMSRKAFTNPEALRNPELVQAVRGFVGENGASLEDLLMSYHGYSSGYMGFFKELANTPLRYFPLAGIARTGFYDFDWFEEALSRSGYSQTAVEQLHKMYQAMVLDDAKGRHASSVIKRFKEGLTDPDGFAEEMALMGYSEEQIPVDLAYAQLEYTTDYALDLLDGYRYAFRKGKISEAEFRRGLENIGMVPERIDGWVFREGVRRKAEEPVPEET